MAEINWFTSQGLSAGTRGKHCVFDHLGLVFVWSCFVFCLLFLLFYEISAPVLTEAVIIIFVDFKLYLGPVYKQNFS